MTLKSTGTIIGKTKLSDTSLIISWSTEQAGLVKTVARGARKPKSPFAGRLDLFYHCEIEALAAKKGDLHILKEIEVIDSRHGLQSSYLQTLGAAYFVKLMGQMVEPQTPVPELHDLLNRGLNYLCTNEVNWRAIEHFENQAAEYLGVASPNHSALDSLMSQQIFIPKIRQELANKLR